MRLQTQNFSVLRRKCTAYTQDLSYVRIAAMLLQKQAAIITFEKIIAEWLMEIGGGGKEQRMLIFRKFFKIEHHHFLKYYLS